MNVRFNIKSTHRFVTSIVFSGRSVSHLLFDLCACSVGLLFGCWLFSFLVCSYICSDGMSARFFFLSVLECVIDVVYFVKSQAGVKL